MSWLKWICWKIIARQAVIRSIIHLRHCVVSEPAHSGMGARMTQVGLPINTASPESLLFMYIKNQKIVLE